MLIPAGSSERCAVHQLTNSSMLTRLRINGFKNLMNVDVRFGPFTCIIGANGAGKSNLFDAIQFLSALADRSLVDAALSIRDVGGRSADIRSLFHHAGDDYEETMSLEAEMIIPGKGTDALRQNAEASTTFLRYAVTIAYREDDSRRSLGSLEILREELDHINIGEATKHLLFPNKPRWRRSVIYGRRAIPFISTEEQEDGRVIVLHQDGSGGGPVARTARNLPRTVLSVANTAATPTALLVRQEMLSWRLLQLEPAALRRPDEFTADTRLDADGAHLPSALYNTALQYAQVMDVPEEEAIDAVNKKVTERLSELIDDVSDIRIDRDQRRELMTLYAKDHNGTSYPARALSDGTLRFLALAVLEQATDAHGVLCLEELENGIHPERIPAIVRLARELATDAAQPIGPENPFRQVILNTHAPAVIAQVTADDLLVAENRMIDESDQTARQTVFACIRGTWRQKTLDAVHTIPHDHLLDTLKLLVPGLSVLYMEDEEAAAVVAREKEEASDLQMPLFS